MTKLYNQVQFKPLRRTLRQTLPKGEVLLWKKLQGKQLGYKFRRQYGVGNYVVDFYCPKARVVIEVDGLSHDDAAASIADSRRQDYLESLGMRVVRFTSEEVFKDIDGVAEKIYQACEKPPLTPP